MRHADPVMPRTYGLRASYFRLPVITMYALGDRSDRLIWSFVRTSKISKIYEISFIDLTHCLYSF